MGCVFNRQPEEVLRKHDIIYPQKVPLKIQKNKSTYEHLKLKLLKPLIENHREIIQENIKFKISACCIPGQDPKGQHEWSCKDSLFCTICQDKILAMVFDGHGIEGDKIVNFSKDFMIKFFTNNILLFNENPEQAFDKMYIECHNALCSSDIDSHMSGTTALGVMLSSKKLHIASVGDCKALIGTLVEMNNLHNIPTEFKHKVRHLVNVQGEILSGDHKPNDEPEMERIKKCGGVIKKLVDHNQQPIGPFRVFMRGANIPGLRISRSLGDEIGKRIGIIPNPIFTSFNYYPGTDQFLVIASDGIWDVMTPNEVSQFVESCRKMCEPSEYLVRPVIKPENSSICRLLCEEARKKWLNIIENEDLMIDDFSCIIIEFEGEEEVQTGGLIRHVQKFRSFHEIENDGIYEKFLSKRELIKLRHLQNTKN
ncbi:unnamed protein product [Blepharisma stoltei]|uniref:PPM-type phosphatase domain-containing protein n=1 Tax=Blepharisma stoltei TaxID=1481888 RepID=A0AAU9J9U0_9CILI|nr:unnamed protein product [Blepharisma stoltei]